MLVDNVVMLQNKLTDWLKLPYWTGDVPHDTATSSEWLQLWTPQPWWLQLTIDVSLPTQRTSSNQIVPLNGGSGTYSLLVTVPLNLQ